MKWLITRFMIGAIIFGFIIGFTWLCAFYGQYVALFLFFIICVGLGHFILDEHKGYTSFEIKDESNDRH